MFDLGIHLRNAAKLLRSDTPGQTVIQTGRFSTVCRREPKYLHSLPNLTRIPLASCTFAPKLLWVGFFLLGHAGVMQPRLHGRLSRVARTEVQSNGRRGRDGTLALRSTQEARL